MIEQCDRLWFAFWIRGRKRPTPPLEGVQVQLAELRGLAKTIPLLIEADRERWWDEIGSRAGHPDEGMIEICESKSSPEEGYRFAGYDRTFCSAPLIMAGRYSANISR